MSSQMLNGLLGEVCCHETGKEGCRGNVPKGNGVDPRLRASTRVKEGVLRDEPASVDSDQFLSTYCIVGGQDFSASMAEKGTKKKGFYYTALEQCMEYTAKHSERSQKVYS